jgi:hypothetical protein
VRNLFLQREKIQQLYEVDNIIVTLDNPNFFSLGGDNRKPEIVCLCRKYGITFCPLSILVGGHPELSTCEGLFSLGLKPSGKQPSQVDNSGSPRVVEGDNNIIYLAW